MNTPLELVAWLGRALRKWRWLALGVGVLAAMLGAAILEFVPTRYEATGRIAVDTQSALRPLLTGLTYRADVDQQARVRLLATTLISRPNVARLLQTSTLAYEPTFTVYTRDELIARLMRDIKVTPMTTPNLYQIAYRGQTPESAGKVVAATLELFGRTSSGSKVRDSEDADRFLETQLNDYAARLTEAEKRLYEFKARHFGGSGVSSQDYFARVAALNEEVDRLRVEASAAERVRDAFRRDENDPYRLHQRQRPDPGEVEAQARAAALAAQLKLKQSQLAQARALADRMPRLENEMAQLTRDQEVARKNYEQILARRESASLGVKVDAAQQLTEFRVVEPPTVSLWPAFPGPLHVAALVLVLAPLLGVAAAGLAERLRPTVHDARGLRLLGDRPVVGTVSVWRTPEAQRRFRLAGAAFALALVAAIVVQALWLAQTDVVPIAQRALGIA